MTKESIRTGVSCALLGNAYKDRLASVGFKVTADNVTTFSKEDIEK